MDSEQNTARDKPHWVSEYEQGSRQSLAQLHRSRYYVLAGFLLFLGLLIYGFTKNHGSERIGLVIASCLLLVPFGGAFIAGCSKKARDAADDPAVPLIERHLSPLGARHKPRQEQ